VPTLLLPDLANASRQRFGLVCEWGDG
jgi:hypothetical protein